jgi:hypothetical protein
MTDTRIRLTSDNLANLQFIARREGTDPTKLLNELLDEMLFERRERIEEEEWVARHP